jgi:hypothetical protein
VPLSDLENPSDVPPYILPEIPESLDRAIRSGAPKPLLYVGAGGYGIVFCDGFGHAWKVTRMGRGSDRIDHLLFLADNLESEYEWLLSAARDPFVRRHAAEVFQMHGPNLVLERECVAGRPGAWADDRKLHELHGKIERAMLPLGWTAPEFKEDSYIIRPDGTPVLVDISMAQRVGENLVRYVVDVLEGRRKTHQRPHDLAFDLLQEMRHKTVPREVGERLIDRLVELDPDIARSFSLEWRKI